jgi:ribosomal protein S18 acetylase RimI-like enzyme
MSERPRHTVSLVPLTLADHAAALQQVYRAVPHYWQMAALSGAPAGQAARDLDAAQATPGRSLLGIVRRLAADDAQAGVEMVGLVDVRLDWPQPQTVYIGMIMVDEPYQRQGIGTQAWRLLAPWLAQSAQMATARLGVEQFNPGALRFFQSLGFTLTGETTRIRSGRRWVRLLFMEQTLAS